MSVMPVVEDDAPHSLNMSDTASSVTTNTDATLNMSFTINLGSASTFHLFQKAKLKSGQTSDEGFIRQMLAEHNRLHLGQTLEDATHVSRGTQVSDIVENKDEQPVDDLPSTSTDGIPSNNTENVEVACILETAGKPSINDISMDDIPANKTNVNSEQVSKLVDTGCDGNHREDAPKNSSDKAGNSDEEEKIVDELTDKFEDTCTTMFGCKECQMYFTRHEKVLSHIKSVHSVLLKDGASCKDFILQESTTSAVKKKWSAVKPKVEFGMISESEVTEAIQSQQKEMKEERKRKRAEKKMKAKTTKMFKCSNCNDIFDRERSLQHHIKLQHSAENQNNLPKCNICNKTFLYESIVKRHMSLMHSPKDSTRKVSKHSKGFLCETCGSTFTQKNTLKLHMNKHLNIKPYVCKHCDKTFTWLNALEYHVRTHTGERPYSCKLCSQRFKTPSDLKRHQVVHTKEKPFACTICPKAFSQRTTLRKHVAKVHTVPNSEGPSAEQTTLDRIISLIPILPQDVQVTISDNTIEFVQGDETCIATLQT